MNDSFNQSRRRFRLAVAGVMLVALAVGLAGINRPPLNSHEVLVVQTAEEMHEHGDWVVPYFGGNLRLNKPPLNYWLTGFVAWLDGAEEFQPWHGRIISVLGGLLIVGMTIWMGRVLFSRSVAVMAGLLAATSVGFFAYTHNARPDMLYAGLCTAMLALFVKAWRTRNRATRLLSAYGVWAVFGLATLSKGPHFPLLYVISFAIILWLHPPSRKRMLAVLHPEGVLLAAAIAVPWWLMLKDRIGSDALMGSQLAGKRYDFSWLAVLDPFYFYRPFQMVLPWVVLWIFAGIVVFEKNARGFIARVLLLMLGLTAVMLSFGESKRWFYFLPMMGPACLLLSLGARRFIQDGLANRGLGVGMRIWYPAVYSVICIGGIIFLGSWRKADLTPFDQGVLVMLIIVMILIGLFSYRFVRKPSISSYRVALGLPVVSFALFLLASGSTALYWEQWRWAYIRMGEKIHENVREGERVVSSMNSWEMIYYSDHPIREFDKKETLAQALEKSPGGLLAVVTAKESKAIDPAIHAEELASVPAKDGETWLLLRLRK